MSGGKPTRPYTKCASSLARPPSCPRDTHIHLVSFTNSHRVSRNDPENREQKLHHAIITTLVFVISYHLFEALNVATLLTQNVNLVTAMSLFTTALPYMHSASASPATTHHHPSICPGLAIDHHVPILSPFPLLPSFNPLFPLSCQDPSTPANMIRHIVFKKASTVSCHQ